MMSDAIVLISGSACSAPLEYYVRDFNCKTYIGNEWIVLGSSVMVWTKGFRPNPFNVMRVFIIKDN
jgi:hypothetical protein